jgi:hypothetical protein
MKHFTFIMALAFAVICSCAAAETNAQPRYAAVLTCFNGKVDSGSFCSTTPAKESKHDAPAQSIREMTCGFPGKVSEIHWRFVGYQGPADVYQVSRRFPSDTQRASTATNSVLYFGKRVAVFEDKDQVIVMEPPKKGQ